MDVITAKNLTFSYSAEPLIANVSFTIRRGDFVCVAGVNGIGKSTLLKLMAGLLKPLSGAVDIAGQYRKSVAYVSQRAAFNRDFPATAEEVVSLGLCGRGKAADKKRLIAAALDKVGLSEQSKKTIGRLSGGQQQRAMLAKALVSAPDIILLDEPTVGIDSGSVTELCCMLAGHSLDGATVVMVTHDIASIMSHANLIINFEKNGVISVMKPNEYFAGLTAVMPHTGKRA